MNWQPGLAATLREMQARAGALDFKPRIESLGRVREVGDGVAMVEGLDEVLLDELVAFSGGVLGQVLDLGRDRAGCILYGPDEAVEAGSAVTRTGRVAAAPVGPGLLGRVVGALGEPRDDRGPILTTETRAVEQDAPGPLQRQPVREPLATGIKAIDAAIPIGLGQRELILGDRDTGKTSLALDTIMNQRDTKIVCVYASIGGKRSAIREVVEELRRGGALAWTVVVVADAAEPPALRYLAPYTAAAIAEWFAYQGRHALVVYDDLTRHAEAYRALSLLLRRPPSREAFPGDVFYLHARLLERAFKLSADLGGGSVTALPILETQRGNITGFLPTNLISITDGQLYLDPALFARGQRPAIDIGRSVSRVGGAAQPAALREASANLRLDLAQYEEVRGFARFGAILDETTKRQLARGERLAALLRQPERQPVALAVEVATFWALNAGLLDAVAPEALEGLAARLVATSADFADLVAELGHAGTIDEALAGELGRWVASAIAGLPAAGEANGGRGH